MVQKAKDACADEKTKVVMRRPDGTFPKGVSGNPAGRKKGSKNQITLLRQSLELALREQASHNIREVLDKAMEMALEGHPGMIKLLLEMHMTKATSEDKEAKEKVSININSGSAPQPVQVEPIEATYEEIEDGEAVSRSEGPGHEVLPEEESRDPERVDPVEDGKDEPE